MADEFRAHRAAYANLLELAEAESSAEARRQIDLDLPRTFPLHQGTVPCV